MTRPPRGSSSRQRGREPHETDRPDGLLDGRDWLLDAVVERCDVLDVGAVAGTAGRAAQAGREDARVDLGDRVRGSWVHLQKCEGPLGIPPGGPSVVGARARVSAYVRLRR